MLLQVWNEPNLQGPEGFYNGTPEQLAQLAKATAEVLAEPRFGSLSVLLLNPPMAGLAADALDFLTKYFVESKRLGVVHTGVAWHSYNLPAGGLLPQQWCVPVAAAVSALLRALLLGDFITSCW